MRNKLFAFTLCMLMVVMTVMPAGAIDLSQYPFRLGGGGIEGYEYDKPYMYPSSFSNLLTVDENLDGVLNPDTEAHDDVVHTTLNLINLAELEKGGTGAFASEPAYCFDFNIMINKGDGYSLRSMDEFSADPTVNNRLRAILSHSFPAIMDMETLQGNVNAWLLKTDGPGYTPVRELNTSEAIMATQTAIWTLTNLIHIDDHLEGITWNFNRRNSMYFDGYGDQDPTESTLTNCAQMIRYLLSLSPETGHPMEECTIANATASLTPEGDGTCTVTIKAKLNMKPDENVVAELQAFCGSLKSDKVRVTAGKQEYTLTLKGVPSAEVKIDVMINGIQLVEDAFLFEPVAGRSNSQVMGGYFTLEHKLDTSVKAVPTPSVPATGDNAPFALLVVLALASVAGAVVLRRKHA